MTTKVKVKGVTEDMMRWLLDNCVSLRFTGLDKGEEPCVEIKIGPWVNGDEWAEWQRKASE